MNADALLFVYGSLRRGSGHAMSAWLAERAVWKGEASVEGVLYRVSWYPALVPASGAGQVRGDLYRLPASLLPELDVYEDIRQQPDDEYRREQGLVQMMDGSCHMAWIYWYVQSAKGMRPVPGGDWLQYQAGAPPE